VLNGKSKVFGQDLKAVGESLFVTSEGSELQTDGVEKMKLWGLMWHLICWQRGAVDLTINYLTILRPLW